jgi:hypothetical protein
MNDEILLPVIRCALDYTKLSVYGICLFSAFVRLYDLAFCESVRFHRLIKVKVFPLFILSEF